jgi:hypothetical protein
MFTRTIAGLPIEVFLELDRPEPGLVLHAVCIRGDGLPLLATAFGLAALLNLLMGGLAAGGPVTAIP